MNFVLFIIALLFGSFCFLFVFGLCISSKKREAMHDEWVAKNRSDHTSEDTIM